MNEVQALPKSMGQYRSRLVQLMRFVLQRKVVLVAAIVLCLADAVILARSLSVGAVALNSADFGAFLRSAHLLASGKNPYDPVYWIPAPFWYGTSTVHDQCPYPPFFSDLIQVLSLPGDTFAYFLWSVFSISALAVTLILLLRHFGTRVPWPWVLLVIGIAFSSYAARNETFHGQANYVLLVCMTLGLWLYGKGNARSAGALWGLIIAVKPFLIVLLLYLLWKRSWRAAVSCIVTGGTVSLVAFGLTLKGSGLTIVRGWLDTTSYFANPPFSARPDNHSIHGLLLRLFAPNPYTIPWVSSGTIITVLSGILLIVLVGAFLLAISGLWQWAGEVPASPVPNAELLVETGLVLALAFTYGPLTEGDHLYLLVPGLVGVFFLTYRRWREAAPTATWWLLTSMLWVMALFRLAIPIQLVVGQASGATWVQVGGPRLLWSGQIGLVLLAATLALAATLWQERQLRLRLAHSALSSVVPAAV